MPTPKEVLSIATYLGYNMLRHGAEISRVEDTVSRICLSYKMDEAHVFAVYSTLIISVSKDGETLTQTRRVNSISTNLDRVDRLNDLSRRICSICPSYEEAIQEIKDIERRKIYHPMLTVLAYALIAGSFAIFFGGDLKDGVVALGVGVAVRLVMLLLEKMKMAPFFITMAASAVVTALAYLAGGLLRGINIDTVIIGTLMNLVPGVAITTSMRDFISTDYMCGMSRVTEALLTAASIAIGASVMLIWQ